MYFFYLLINRMQLVHLLNIVTRERGAKSGLCPYLISAMVCPCSLKSYYGKIKVQWVF